MVEYKDEYASSIDSAILRCLNACTSIMIKRDF